MKHVKIVLSLLVVVLSMSVAVFVVENELRPEIEQAAIDRANLAKDAVLPGAAEYPGTAVEPLLVVEMDTTGTGIDGIYYYEGLGFVYQVTFKGYIDDVTYMLGFDELGTVTGYQTLSQNETSGLGGKIGESKYWDQFIGKTTQDLQNGNFDGWSGATETTTKWKDSMNKVFAFHHEILLTTFFAIEYIDVSNQYTLPDEVLKVEEVTMNGSPVAYILTGEFIGYDQTPANTFTVRIDITDNSIENLVFTEINDTANIGGHIADSAFTSQFIDMTQEQAVNREYDAVGGVTYPKTFESFDSVFTKVYNFYLVSVKGLPPKTQEELVAEWYVELSYDGGVFNDKTADYDITESPVTKIEVNGSFMVMTVEYDSNGTPVTLMVGVNTITNFITGIRVVEPFGSEDDIAKIADVKYLEQFTGMYDLMALYGEFEGVAGAETPMVYFKDALFKTFTFYRTIVQEDDRFLLEPPAPEPVDSTDLDPVLGGVTNFFDVTSNYPLNATITNIYEAQDANGNVLGYVYRGYVPGGFLNVEFLWGVQASGLTTELVIVSDGTSWDQAASSYPEYSDYAGNEIFSTSTFLDLYEGVQIDTVPSTVLNLDAWAGVSTTTNGMKAALEGVAQYHIDNVGGGN